jgi:cell division protein FtsZ
MIFITAGMGGGTGTGAAPVIASIAKDLGALTIGIVSKPFTFEGKKRMTAAEMGLHNLEKCVDSLFVMNNQTMIDEYSNLPVSEAFDRRDLQTMHIVKGISDIILKKGLIDVDFADIKTIFSNSGYSRFIQGKAKNIRYAAHYAIRDEFLEDISLENARGVLVNITAAKPTLSDHAEFADILEEIVPGDANMIFALTNDETAGDDILVSILFSVGRFNQKNNLKRFIRKKQTTASDINFLDIPTFMRKQVD